MTVKIDIDLCSICSQCILVCAKNALIGWDYPKVDDEKCNDCGRCIDYCPSDAIALVPTSK